MSNYKPGSFFLTPIKGAAGYGIALAQALAGDPSRYTHAGLILDEAGTIIEAELNGARLASIREYGSDALLISDGPVQRQIALGDPRSEAGIRADVVAAGRKFVGVPYSLLDYAAIAALHLHLPSKWIRQRVQSSGHLICSQLVDAAYLNAGVHLFNDGRLPGDVAPADLSAWAEDWDASQR